MMKFEFIKNTQIYDAINKLHKVYGYIEKKQQTWKKVSPMQCPQGCGSCCVDFEPDVLEVEALYMGAWLLQHDKSRAEEIAEGSFFSSHKDRHPSGCFLFNPDSEFHCTVYEGRALICRLFGYCGDTGKDGKIRWKPCKMLAEGLLQNGFIKRQYTEDELLSLTGALPPVMSSFLYQAIAILPEDTGRTIPLSEALPKAIRKLQLIMSFINPTEPESPNDTPTPSAPLAA